jgi:hypothetical protein
VRKDFSKFQRRRKNGDAAAEIQIDFLFPLSLHLSGVLGSFPNYHFAIDQTKIKKIVLRNSHGYIYFFWTKLD